jgi:hypothetical protein
MNFAQASSRRSGVYFESMITSENCDDQSLREFADAPHRPQGGRYAPCN